MSITIQTAAEVRREVMRYYGIEPPRTWWTMGELHKHTIRVSKRARNRAQARSMWLQALRHRTGSMLPRPPGKNAKAMSCEDGHSALLREVFNRAVSFTQQEIAAGRGVAHQKKMLRRIKLLRARLLRAKTQRHD